MIQSDRCPGPVVEVASQIHVTISANACTDNCRTDNGKVRLQMDLGVDSALSPCVTEFDARQSGLAARLLQSWWIRPAIYESGARPMKKQFLAEMLMAL